MRNARQFQTLNISTKSLAFSVIVAATFIVMSTQPSRSAVEVDLSVLDDGGFAGSTSAGNLKMPSTEYPRSEYFGPPVSVTFPVPEPEPKTEVMAAPEPAPSPEPEPAPEPAAVPEPPAPEVATAPASDTLSDTAELSSAGNAPPPPPEPAALEISPTPTSESIETSDTTNVPLETASEPAMATETASTGAQSTAGIRVVFSGEDTRLPDGAESTLDPIAAKASADDSVRIQLRAYAGGGDISASKARRLSLSRALAVRSYLIEQGVRSTRIDVRALGDKVDDDPINRVDIDVGAR